MSEMSIETPPRFYSLKILHNRSYPIPRVHNTIILNAERHSQSKRNLGLGVNEHTGRIQWCPGFTCYKFFVLIPVAMLPVALVLILLMRMDGMLLALQMTDDTAVQDQSIKFQNNLMRHYGKYVPSDGLQNIAGDYAYVEDENPTSIVRDFPHPIEELSDVYRNKRCQAFRIGMSESLDIEERDIMKDARTSFLPLDTSAIPIECIETMNFGSQYEPHEFNVNKANVEDFLRKRSRRTSDRNFMLTVNASKFGSSPVRIDPDWNNEEIDNDAADEGSIVMRINDDDSIYEDSESFQSFWNAHGTKESLRSAQARTMKRYMDTSVDPCVDFYKFSCGNWEKLHPIPKDKAGFDTFEMLRESLDLVLKQLLESNDPSTNGPVDSADGKVGMKGNQYKGDSKRDSDLKRGTINRRPIDSDTVAANFGNEEQSKSTNSREDLRKERAALLRRHIVRHRKDLSRILMRFKRHTTNTKRKRLVSYYTHSRIPKNIPSVLSAQNARQKAKYLYQSCINSQLLEKRGIQPLLKLINDFGGWPVLDANWNENRFDWLNLTANLRRYNNDILIVQWVGPDIKNSDENVIQFDQTSLGLPTREYFLQEVNAKYLNAYQVFMSEVMQKLGAPPDEAKRTAQELINFETQLASITSPAEERLNVTKLYKRMTLRQLNEIVPAIKWKRYLTILQERNVDDNEEVVIYATDYMHDLVNLLSLTEPRTVSNYLMWRFVRHRINNVDDRFEDIKQNFYHTLFGREESPSRWKVCIAQVNTNMGMALGSMFVQKYFDENSKRDTLRMTHELQQAFRDILKTTNWLDAGTKSLAEDKVNAMSLKIGYPDFILNQAELDEKYAGIEIHPDTYFENTLNVLLHTSQTEQRKLHEPVNKTNWQTAPAIVNAYYSRNKNQIMFPAGILQPPFYHRYFPRSLNFGGIGVVIGHELTHGFDDKGRLFDRNGSIHKWWTDDAIRGFDERARCIIAQYNNYTVGEVGISLNGESTQGENIADNGGIRQAFHAYKRWLRDNPSSVADECLPGINLTGEQLFFLNFGQVWCGAMRPEAVRNKLNTAIHSPGRFRVIGTVSNSNDFANEFKCPVGSPMNPVRKCAVW